MLKHLRTGCFDANGVGDGHVIEQRADRFENRGSEQVFVFRGQGRDEVDFHRRCPFNTALQNCLPRAIAVPCVIEGATDKSLDILFDIEDLGREMSENSLLHRGLRARRVTKKDQISAGSLLDEKTPPMIPDPGTIRKWPAESLK
jgi:hypothetical protein